MARWWSVLTVVVVTWGGTASWGADWPQWRGLQRDGRSPETNLLQAWPAEGPKLLWSARGLGKGYSSVAVAQARVYATGMLEKTGYLFVYDLKGNLLWKRAYGPEWLRSFLGPRSTPTVDGERVYVMSSFGKVLCFAVNDGRELWSVDVLERFGAKNILHGISESVLIDEDKVICTPGGKDACMVALNKLTGETVWTSKGYSATPAYCSPILIEHGGRRMVVTLLVDAVVGIDAESGQLLWEDKFADYQKKPEPSNAVSPIYHQGYIYTTSGCDDGGAMLVLSEDGKSVSRKWTDIKLDVFLGGVVLVDGFIYGGAWTSHEKGRWVCLDWESGKVMYEATWPEKDRQGPIIYADGRLYCYDDQEGHVALVKATPKGFEVVSSFQITEGEDQYWAHPAISDGRLYLRHGEVLMVYDIRDGAGAAEAKSN